MGRSRQRWMGLLAFATAVVMVMAPTSGAGQSGGSWVDPADADAGTASNVEGQAWWEGWSMEDPRLSQPIHEESIEELLPLTLRDGVALEATVTRPLTPDGVRVPTILVLSPYFGLMDLAEQAPRLIADRYVARGYALVGVSIRGTGPSEGCLDFSGEIERADYVEILDAIVSQPWSDGRVGTYGQSWVGTTQNAALLIDHPALRTAVPIAAISDWHRYIFLNGVQNFQAYSWNLHGMFLVSFGAWRGGAVEDDVAMLGERVCPEQAETQLAGLSSGPLGTRNAWWEERNFVRHLRPPSQETGVLLVHGYRDTGVSTENVRDWLPALVENGFQTRALLGQWDHEEPPASAFPIYSVTLLRWFDYWLKGADTGILDMPAVVTQGTSRSWHEEDGFVPSRAESRRLHFDSGGRLATRPGGGTAVFVDNGVPPTGPGGGPEAVYYVTAPVDEPLRYSGPADVQLDLTHTAPRGQVAVSLYEVTPDGGWSPIDGHYGFANYGLRNSPYLYEPVIPGQTFSVTVPLLLQDVVIPAGHRLGVAIGNQVPLFTGDIYVPPPSGGATLVLHGSGSYLELPVTSNVDVVRYDD